MKLNLGCGLDYKDGWINHDISNIDFYGNKIKVDITSDLNKYPWIWQDNSFDEIKAWGILEHLENKIKPFQELKRIAKNGCRISIHVPHRSGEWASDPTHYHCYSYTTGERIAEMYGFKLISSKIKHSSYPILKFMNFFVNLKPKLYEFAFANILPSEELHWEFEVVKKEKEYD